MLRHGQLDGDCARIYNFDELAGLALLKVNPPLQQTYLSNWALSSKTDRDLATRTSAVPLPKIIQEKGYAFKER